MVLPDERLTFVTVVFGAEARLVELQAQSLARYLDPDAVASIVVIDNGWRPLSRRRRERLSAAYGPLSDRMSILRTVDVVPDLPPTIGWRSQQLAKLLVARTVDTDHYVLLDAKNLLIRPTVRADFVGSDGRAHGGTHPYSKHPLQPQLIAALRYLGGTTAVIDRAVDDFPPTATPFVMDTAITRVMLDGIELASSLPFAREFELRKLTEFFLYSGWIVVRGPGLDAVYDGVAVPSPTVWPKHGRSGGVEIVIQEAERNDSAFFAVHRTTLARGDRATRARVAQFWTQRGLFPSESAARRFIGAFRRAYLPEMALKKLAERVRVAKRG